MQPAPHLHVLVPAFRVFRSTGQNRNKQRGEVNRTITDRGSCETERLEMAALMRWHLSWGWKDKEPGVKGLGERPFQAEGAAGVGATEQTGAGMLGNRKSGLGQGRWGH